MAFYSIVIFAKFVKKTNLEQITCSILKFDQSMLTIINCMGNKHTDSSPAGPAFLALEKFLVLFCTLNISYTNSPTFLKHFIISLTQEFGTAWKSSLNNIPKSFRWVLENNKPATAEVFKEFLYFCVTMWHRTKINLQMCTWIFSLQNLFLMKQWWFYSHTLCPLLAAAVSFIQPTGIRSLWRN